MTPKDAKVKVGEIDMLVTACKGPCGFRPMRWTPDARVRDRHNFLLVCPTCQKAQCRLCYPEGARQCLTCAQEAAA